jgi:Zn-finger protein
MSHKFFQNKECEYFPCQDGIDVNKFNCMFCFCPLYTFEDCGGSYTVLKNGWKDCSGCLIPHTEYDYIIDKIRELHK